MAETNPMYGLAKGDVIVSNSEGVPAQEVLGRLEDLLFTRDIRLDEAGSMSAPQGPILIEDLVNRGFTKEEV